ncbi:hypothetical protein BG09_5630 [Bacillus thuringiensis serovar kurstaki str. HD-1]|nr:hypothetical protein HD73_2965 [Bacillus thuringiensis serovar kurstaki str. HD73]EEM52907.1 hypothetical protein bthur0006_27210 [Bacillus thuringiensis serovar kurstaki str. T03a001]KEH45666.1 hypothetical protein BG09_5630 [Bacillus thuringiensis serovar kurstaki str. HD-1]KLA02901.1 hypothetical protein B4158_2955 [Bacillus cereus]
MVFISLYCFKMMKKPEMIKRKDKEVSKNIISNIKYPPSKRKL